MSQLADERRVSMSRSIASNISMSPPGFEILYVTHTICIASDLASGVDSRQFIPCQRDEMPRDSNLKRREQPEDFEAPELMFAELDSLLGYLLRRAQGAMHRDFMAAVADFGLTQKQAAALWLIQANRRRLAGRSGRGAGHGSRHHDGGDGPAGRSRLRHSQAFVDRPAPAGAIPDAVGAKHVAKVQVANCRARREVPRDVHGVRTRGAARRPQEIPKSRLT